MNGWLELWCTMADIKKAWGTRKRLLSFNFTSRSVISAENALTSKPAENEPRQASTR